MVSNLVIIRYWRCLPAETVNSNLIILYIVYAQCLSLRIHVGGQALLLPAGFGRLPKGVSISPGDGYGTLLPLETLPLTFSFMPPLTGPYTFQLECRTPLTTHFSLPCTAMAVLPAVTLSHNCIKV